MTWPMTWPLSSYRPVDYPAGRLTLVTKPATEPLSVPEAKDHCRITVDHEDGILDGLIQAAREHVERMTGRQLITATWKLVLDQFPCGPLEIPVAPLLTVVSVKYRDVADVLQTWSSAEYIVDAPAGPHANTGRIYPKFDKAYPPALWRPDAVEVEFTAGYGTTPESVPQKMRQAMLLLMEHWYANRGATTEIEMKSVPLAVDALLDSFTRLAY